MIDVVCVGVLTVDVFLRQVPRSLAPGDYVFLSDAQLQPGGTALNTAIDLARLGLRASVIGSVGADLAGQLLFNTLRAEGVDVSRLVSQPGIGTPSWYSLTAPDGQEHYFYFGGSNEVVSEGEVPDEVLAACRVLHIGGAQHLPRLDGEPCARLLQRARRAGCLTALDPTENTTPENAHQLWPALPHLDYFFPNLDQALVVSRASTVEAAADQLLEHGVKTVVIKLGHAGCYVARGPERLRLPAYPANEVDSTGAGDAFIAGFLLAQLSGWDLQRAGQLGNACGALAVQAVGPISVVVTRDTAFSFLKQHEPLWPPNH